MLFLPVFHSLAVHMCAPHPIQACTDVTQTDSVKVLHHIYISNRTVFTSIFTGHTG